MTRRTWPLSLGFLLVMSGGAAEAGDYLKEVKPLLAKKCSACHGVLKQEGGLRLDASQFIRKGSDSGPVIVPGQAAGSLLIQRVATAEEADRMPPAGEGEALKPDQLAILQEWINAGAEAPGQEEAASDPRTHWAWQKPIRPDIPPGSAGPSTSPIDALLEAKRQERGLATVASADKATLLRRVTFDLTGLPPTREELIAFLNDESANAYERRVDDLLSRPGYGERWGRHWMDVWRYSDWDGFGTELRGSQKHIWRWRDWIIDSLNADKPYDQMIREMLAGDEIAPTDNEVLCATGFLSRNYYKFNRQMWLDNVVEHTGKAFLGLTLNCAKCHDHKYDPLAQTDYYRFQAIFEPYQTRLDRLPGFPNLELNGLSRVFDSASETPTYLLIRGDERRPDQSHAIPPGVPAVFGVDLAPAAIELPSAAWMPFLDGPELASLKSQVEEEVTAASTTLVDAERKWEQARAQLWILKTEPMRGSGQQASTLVDNFTSLDDAQWQAEGGLWEIVDGHLRQTNVAAETAALVTRDAIPSSFRATFRFRILGGETYHSTGLSFDWGGVANATGVYLSAHGPAPKMQVSLTRDGATTYPQDLAKTLPIEKDRTYELEVRVRDTLLNVFVDGQLAVASRLPERRPGRLAVWSFDSRSEFLGLSLAELPETLRMAQPGEEAAGFATSVEQAADILHKLEGPLIVARRAFAAAAASRRSFDQRLAADRAEYLGETPDERPALVSDAARGAAIVALLQAEVALERARQSADAAENARKPDDAASITAANEAAAAKTKAHAALLEARTRMHADTYPHLHEPYPKSSTGRRSALARWITSRDNPLAARVAVNHVWLRHFGRPLVDNVFDFGLRSPEPRHLAVLDWLAVELMEQNWSFKHLHRAIVLSDTYRRASAPAGDALPLWTQNRALDPDNLHFWRAEVRRLDAEEIRDAVLAASGSLDSARGGEDIDQAEGERLPRRSVYFRNAYEKQMRFLTTFDVASPNECYRRSDSIVPHQALAMSNSLLTLEESRILAERLWKESESTAAALSDREDQFLRRAFETTLSRPPSGDELHACREFLCSQEGLFNRPAELTNFSGGEQPRRPAASAAEQRARENMVHVLFNHNDFATVR